MSQNQMEMNMIFRHSCENMRIKFYYILLTLLIFGGCASSNHQLGSLIAQDHFSEIQADPIPLVMNDRVQDWINYFQGPAMERFELYLRRSGRYIPMMKRILRQYGLPEDLVYLAMIESGFNPLEGRDCDGHRDRI